MYHTGSGFGCSRYMRGQLECVDLRTSPSHYFVTLTQMERGPQNMTLTTFISDKFRTYYFIPFLDTTRLNAFNGRFHYHLFILGSVFGFVLICYMFSRKDDTKKTHQVLEALLTYLSPLKSRWPLPYILIAKESTHSRTNTLKLPLGVITVAV